MNNIFVSQWRIFLELNFNLLSQCRKTYEMNNFFDSIWQIFESWITNIVPQRRKSSEVKNNFVSQCRKIWELNFNFVSECPKKIWGEIQNCVIVLKKSNSDWHFCLTLPKVLKIKLEVSLTTSKKLWDE